MMRFLYLIFAIASISHAGIETYFKKAENKSDFHKIQGIDFIYVINLDPRPEKYEKTMDAFRPYNINPYRFSAVNGWQLSFAALDELGIIFDASMPEGPIASVYRHVDGEEFHSHEIMKTPGVCYYCHSLSRGAIGCILSHLSVLQDAYDSGYRTVWVMEDDVNVVSNPHELSSLIQDLDRADPAWDVLFTDNEIKGANGPIPCTVIRPRPLVHLHPLEYYLRRNAVTKDIWEIGMRFGATSMIIRRSGIEKILNYFKTYKLFFPYDIDYFYVPTIRLYAMNRDIVTNIAAGISDNGAPAYLEKTGE